MVIVLAESDEADSARSPITLVTGLMSPLSASAARGSILFMLMLVLVLMLLLLLLLSSASSTS